MQMLFLLAACWCGAAYALQNSDNVAIQSLLTRMQLMERRHALEADKLYAKIDELNDKVNSLTAKTAEVQGSISVNRRDVVDNGIAFTSYLDHDRDDIAGNQTIVFNRVLSNIGNGYDNTTGIFTAPLDGVYFFTFFVGQKGDNQVFVGLKKNGVHQVEAAAEGVQNGHDVQGANAAVLQLAQGDEVLVNHHTGRQGSHVEGGRNLRVSTFSGFLLYRSEVMPGLIG